MSRLIEHAKREMELAGLYDKDADFGGMIPQAVMALIEVHAKQGHSGASHTLTMSLFNTLASFKALSPLTNDPSEWIDRTKESGRPMWQSARQSSCFSQDGGKTYYDIDENVNEIKVAKAARKEK